MDNRVTMVSPGGNTRQYFVAKGSEVYRNLVMAGYTIETTTELPEPEPTPPEDDEMEDEDEG